MPLLSRFYDSKADALQAAGKLKQRGLRDAAANIIDNTSGYVGENTLLRKGVLKKNAKQYAEQVRAGKVLLLVDVPFMGTARATEILDEGSVGSTYEGGVWEEAAPFSSALNLPVLVNNPAAFSSFWGLPVLKKSRPAPAYGKPLRPATLYSAIFGPLLTKSGAPTSFGLPLLTSGKPTSFGLPLLTKRGKPIGFGLPLLARDRSEAGL